MAGRHPLFVSALTSAALVALTLASTSALALVGGSRQPVDAEGNQVIYQPADLPNLSVNPERAAVHSADGYQTVTSLAVDANAGTVRGFASYALEADTTVARPEAPGLVGAMGNLVFVTTVQADPNNPQPSAQNITLEWQLHGSMLVTQGQPWLALAGSVGISQYLASPVAVPALYYAMDVTFSNTTAAGWQTGAVATLTPSFTGDEAIAALDPFSSWGQGSMVLSDQPSDLSAVLRLTVPVMPGDTLALVSLSGATATHAFTSDPHALPVADPIAVTAASGQVDFSNTATLRVYVPQGLLLSGPQAPAGDIVVYAAVPEPGMASLMLAGLSGLGGLVWRQRRQLGAQPQAKSGSSHQG